MIDMPADFQRGAVLVVQCTRKIGKQTFLDFRAQPRFAVFRAEYEVDVYLCERLRHLFGG